MSTKPVKGFIAPVFCALALNMFAAAAPAAASDGVLLSTEYSLNLAGFPLAEFRMQGRFDGDNYAITASGGSLALTSVIAPFEADSSAGGRINAGAIIPVHYKLKLEMSKVQQHVDIGFGDGGVTQLAVSPNVQPADDRIPLKSEHKKDVLDPLSAALMPIPNGSLTGENACLRSLPIFDGSYRYDMVLSPKRIERLPVAGAPDKRTEVYVCKIKYVPIAGHRPHRKMTEYWMNSEDIEIWLMSLRSVGVLVPYRIVIPTPIGNALVNVTKIRLQGTPLQAAAR